MFNHCLLEFKRELEREEVSERTVKAYTDKSGRFIKYLQERSLDYLAVSQDEAKGYMHYLLLVKKNGGNTRYGHFAALKRFYEFLVRGEKISVNPFDGIKPPRKERRRGGYLTNDEIELMIAAPGLDSEIGKRDTALLCLLVASGARVSAMTRLTVNDFRVERSLVPPKCGHCGQVDYSGGSRMREKEKEMLIMTLREKGNKVWDVPVHEKAVFYIYLYLQNRDHGKDSKVIFPSYQGKKDPADVKPITREGILKLVKKYGAAAEVKGSVSPHMFRGAAATWMLDIGTDPMVVQKFLGHAALSTTEIYRNMTHRSFTWSGVAGEKNLLEAIKTPADNMLERGQR